MQEVYENALEAKLFIKRKTKLEPKTSIVLGTGLGSVIEDIQIDIRIPYEEIPHFPCSSVKSHAGELIIGRLEGKELMVMSGRFHYYEGYDLQDLTFPIRVLNLCGIENLLITNVAGGLNPAFHAGDVVLISDHINLLPDNPLRGFSDDRFGPRFPDMKYTYRREFIDRAKKIGKSLGMQLKEGVYVCMQGPSLETPAECKFLRTIGADLVGMSTVPEVIVARQMGMQILAASLISNINFPPERMHETSLDEVIQIAKKNEVKMRKLLHACIKELI